MASARQETVKVISRCRLFCETVLSTTSQNACSYSGATRSCFYPWNRFTREPRTRLACQSTLLAEYRNARYTVNMAKKKTSIRLSSEAKALLEQLSKKLGVSQSAVLELAIRIVAKQEGLTQ